MTDDQRQALLTRMRAMSAADLSILEAAFAEPSGEPIMVTTTPGSKNDFLWSDMVTLGWMSAAPSLDVPIPTKVFVVNSSAKEQIASLLSDNRRADAMTKLVNDLRADIPPRLIEAVHGAEGTPADLAFMLAGIVESTMRRAIRSELHDEFLREVLRIAQGMRAI